MSIGPDTGFDLQFTRRQVLRLSVAGAAVLSFPARRLLGQLGTSAASTPVQMFLTADELAIVDAATARIIPTDTNPGAHEAGVADYIQGMLSLPFSGDANCDGAVNAADAISVATQAGAAAAASCPLSDVNGDGTVDERDRSAVTGAIFGTQMVAPIAQVFAGGPFSGRQPFGDFDTGQITTTFPPDNFQNFIPLTRLQGLAWAVRLDGASAVPEVANNPLVTSLDSAILLDYVNLRSQYRTGLAQLDQTSQTMFGMPFVELTTGQQDQVLSASQNSTFVSLLTMHTLEGFMSDPVYGGNRNFVGWQVAGFDGDSQPLGYTLGFDDSTQQYIQRTDKPNSGPNPDETCSGFSTKMAAFLSAITTLSSSISAVKSPTMVFPNPFCFGVST